MSEIKKPRSLTFQILVAMALGLVLGLIINKIGPVSWIEGYIVGGFLHVGGTIFISLLKVMVVPLVFVSLVCGTASVEDLSKLGRIGGKTLGLYVSTTAMAISLALLASVILKPGSGFELSSETNFQPQAAPSLVETVIQIFPSNPFQAFVEANMLQIIVFAGMFGFALASSGAAGKRILSFFSDMNEVVMRMVMMIMYIAPFGVFCLIGKVFSEQGLHAIMPLAKYFVIVCLVLFLHATLVYPSLLKFFTGLSPIKFFQNFRSVLVFAFSTSSSGATLPITLENVEHKLGVDNSIASFTVPLGATINMDGTAIMQGVATVFIAQAYGVNLQVTDLLLVVVTATLASVGTAAVPGVGLITLAMVLKQVNLPVEGIGLIIGVDRILDMVRTAVNVTGDAVVSLIVAKSENRLSSDVFFKD